MATRRTPRSRRFDDDGWEPDPTTHPLDPSTRDASTDRPPDDHPTDHPVDQPAGHPVDQPATGDAPSSYPDAARGPQPPPPWLVTDARARDTDLGVVKTGKEAEVSLMRRSLPSESCLLAVKRYRSADHRLFHRQAGYLEGRRVRKTRETRAMATGTAYGRQLVAEQWAVAEFDVLCRLWTAGVAVPYPVQLLGSEVTMEFLGSTDGVAAPRLAQLHSTPRDLRGLYDQLVDALVALAEAGYAHGDLSAYNVLVHDGRVVLIDLPQAVDLVGNPQGFSYLRRDCENICSWFAPRGVTDADADQLLRLLVRHGGGGDVVP